jgi:dolichyl-phosphate-mannose--protein O-mannosyl transferase
MSNGTNSGIYNDANNEWIVEGIHNSETRLYFNGLNKLNTLTNGVSINGNLYTDGSNAEDYDALSGTSPTCNVDNAGAFSLTMSGNTTFTFSGADSGWSMGFILQLTGNGSTVTWPSTVRWAGGAAPDAPASGETDVLVFHTRDGGSNWYGVLASDAAA